MNTQRLVAVLMLAAATTGCGRTESPSPAASSSDFDGWADGFAEEWVRASPQLATHSQYFSGAEQDGLDRQLSMIGEWDWAFGSKALADRAAQARRGLEALDRFDAASLTPQQRTSAAVIRWSLEDVVRLAEFPHYRYVLDQFNGFQLDLINTLTQSHPIRRARDVENYLARLTLVAGRVDEAIAEARAAQAAGVLPPRVIIQRMIEQLDGFLKTPARQNVFVTTLATRIASMREPVSDDVRASSMGAAEKTVGDAIIPAYQRIRAMLQEQLPKATDDAGVWRLPRGAEYYAAQLATYTNTSLTADEIHAIGLREVARIEGEMDAILRQLGYSNGTVNERYRQLEAAVQPKGPGDPRPQILADAEKWVRDAEKRAALVFDKTPRAPVEVRREPAFTEKTAAAHYTDPASDGSRPGVYYLPLPGPPYELVRMRSLAYHEAVPGHHFQIAMQQEADLPKYRRLLVFAGSSAFTEGWGLYAERLADENNWYEGDPPGRLGFLQMQLLRARRLVVDTGIHAKRWTRQQVIDYGITPQEADRYIAWPGQACAYMIGQLRIIELREKARMALGDRFSIKAYHNLVLETGSVPLEVLGQEVDAWILRERGGKL
jgi:uncharacterized protein (DUF885 family)